jgi:hypothetical protein
MGRRDFFAALCPSSSPEDAATGKGARLKHSRRAPFKALRVLTRHSNIYLRSFFKSCAVYG